MRRLSSKNKDTVSSIEDIEPPAVVTLASTEIRKFLRNTIAKRKTDIIISTIRKGSWIIDDILRTSGIGDTLETLPPDGIDNTHWTSDSKIVHCTNGDIEKITSLDPSDKHVLVFDDSIHNGDGALDILSKIKGFADVRVVCIAINPKFCGCK